MGLKPAQQGSHPTRTPFCQTLESAAPSGGEARGRGRPFAGVWGRCPQGLLARKIAFRQSLLDGKKAEIWGRRSRKIGGLPPAPPLCRVLTPLQPPNGGACGG